MKSIIYSLAFFIFFSGILIGYELSKWANLDSYDPPLLNGIILIIILLQIWILSNKLDIPGIK